MPKVIIPKDIGREGGFLGTPQIEPDPDYEYSLRLFLPGGPEVRKYQSEESRNRYKNYYNLKGIKTRRI